MAHAESCYLLQILTSVGLRGVFVESEFVRAAGKLEIVLGKMKKVTLDGKEVKLER